VISSGAGYWRCSFYSVRSGRNWGIGDFTDLEGLIETASDLGADGVGLNPLHALFDDRPRRLQSLFAKTAGCFLNPLYIDVEKLGEFQPGTLVEYGDKLAGLRAGDIVDYVAVAGLKWHALRSAFKTFPKPTRKLTSCGIFEKIPRWPRPPCCRASPVLRCCGTNSTRRGGNGRKNGRATG